MKGFIDAVLEDEKKEFQPGLETFEMHADRLSNEMTESMQKFQTQYTDGFTTLVEALAEQGFEPPRVREEALAVFEDSLALQNALEQGNAIYQLLEFSPETMKNFFEIGLNLVKNGNYAKAKDVFYFLTTIASDTPAFWLGLGFCNAKLKNYDEARGAFRQVIALDPQNGDAYMGCVNALLKQNSPQEALKVCEEGLATALAHQNEPWAATLQGLLGDAQTYVKSHFLSKG